MVRQPCAVSVGTCCTPDVIEPQKKALGMFYWLYILIFHTQKLSCN